MRNVIAIAWRDIRSVFVSPIAYVVLTGFVLLAGWFFVNLLGQFDRTVAAYSSVQGYDTTWLNLNDAVIGPLLQNLASTFMITLMVGLACMFPAILLVYGNPEIGLIFSGFLGLYLTAVTYVAVGNFTSALTSIS